MAWYDNKHKHAFSSKNVTSNWEVFLAGLLEIKFEKWGQKGGYMGAKASTFNVEFPQ